jgi:hypothetical protein
MWVEVDVIAIKVFSSWFIVFGKRQKQRKDCGLQSM